jgi:sortase (surface protein transpeptidase)
MTPGRSRGRVAAGLVALVLAAGCSAAGAERSDEGRPAAAGAADAPATTAGGPATTAGGLEAARGFRSTRGYRATPAPVRLEIPAIRVDTGLQRLGQEQDGTVEVPKGPHQWDMAGWYAEGTRPGDPGSAVILGHVDSKSDGPAVFFRLRDLRRGDEIKVVRADGSTVRFAVDRTEQFPKSRFPTDDVYYPTLTPGLRLVTCGGSFDATAGHYRSNVIVFATLRT